MQVRWAEVKRRQISHSQSRRIFQQLGLLKSATGSLIHFQTPPSLPSFSTHDEVQAPQAKSLRDMDPSDHSGHFHTPPNLA